MKLRSGRHIVRRKNVYLPTEVWVDIFCFPWITRWELARMVDKIGNRWFGEQLQFYLHEWGKWSLGNLHFTSKGIVKWHNLQFKQLEFPQTAMPENINFFESFRIDHFDNQIFNFFRRIQSVLTADTKLEIRFNHELTFLMNNDHLSQKQLAEQLDNARTILGHLLPFIDGIHTMHTDGWMMVQMKSLLLDQFHKVKVFRFCLNFQRPTQLESAIQITMEWLTCDSNEPKLLHLGAENGIAKQVLEVIRKQFLEATKPSTFAVSFSSNCDFPTFNCENAIGEQLCGMQKEKNFGKFRVLRHQANNADEASDKLRKWMKENTEDGDWNRKQWIHLCKLTIGEGRIFAMPDLDGDEADEKEDADEKPSTSKKRRICE